jgi:hypothetical protein
MKSGRIEYAPDYKSEKSECVQVPPPAHVHFDKSGRAYADPKRLVDAELGGAATTADERARLEREVIEAAKAERDAYGAPTWEWTSTLHAAQRNLRKAVRALTEFESKQK